MKVPLKVVGYCLTLLFLIGIAWGHLTVTANADEFIRVKDKTGDETQLLQKLVTVKRTNPIRNAPNPDERSQAQVTAYKIYYHLKTDSGAEEENGFYRIGNSKGKHIGWIETDNVQKWGTRYVIKPEKPKGDNVFTVKDEKTGLDFGYTLDQDKATVTSYCFILEPPESGDETKGPFHVSFCTQQVASADELRSRQQISDMGLEIVFVIENMFYLRQDYGGDTSTLDALYNLADSLAQRFGSKNIPVNFGLIRTADDHPLCKVHREAQIVCPLTPDLNQWSQKLRQITGQSVNSRSDRENDGLTGIDMAINKMNWRADGNSSKHIIYIGFAPFQKYPYKTPGTGSGGPPESLPDPDHYLAYIYHRWNPNNQEWSGWHLNEDGSLLQAKFEGSVGGDYLSYLVGGNKCGKWIDQLRNEAFRGGGNRSTEERRKKHLHAVHIGMRVEDLYTPQQIKTYREADKNVTDIFKNSSSEEVDEFFGTEAGLPFFVPCLECFWLTATPAYEAVTIRQFKKLAGVDTPNEGYYSRLQPDNGVKEIGRIRDELSERIEKGVEIIDKIGKGETVTKDKDAGEIAEPIFSLLDMDKASKVPIDPNEPVRVGMASLRNAKTKKFVGEKRVMVSYKEIRKLAELFKSIHDEFMDMGDEEKQDATQVVNTLKRLLGALAAGQAMTADTNIQELITELPLKTEALNITADDIAVMSSKNFQTWLEDLKIANAGLNDLLKDTPGKTNSRWQTITDEKNNPEYFSFVPLHQLP